MDSLRIVNVAPTDARIMHVMASHWARDKCSCRKNRPERAPNAGSILIKVPNVRAGRRVSATISNVYGKAVDRIATPMAIGIRAGVSSAAPACTIPIGATNRAAIEDGVEANFVTVAGCGHRWRCGNHKNRSETG